MAYFNIPCYEIPELTVDAEESDFYQRLLNTVRKFAKKLSYTGNRIGMFGAYRVSYPGYDNGNKPGKDFRSQ